MSDEKTETRDEEPEVEAHKYVSEEPGEDDAEKTKAKFKFKTKTRASDDIGSDELGDRPKF
jgi:hypothetical protein